MCINIYAHIEHLKPLIIPLSQPRIKLRKKNPSNITLTLIVESNTDMGLTLKMHYRKIRKTSELRFAAALKCSRGLRLPPEITLDRPEWRGPTAEE